ncbi:MAG TPA: hypothetical protein VFK12_10145 [Gammaproteobacteria bacterium]|nr:hypothetical protein [Gammaproteobacteria bacterium]
MTEDENDEEKRNRIASWSDRMLAQLLGRRVIGVAIKRITTDNPDLQGPGLLLLTLDNGRVLIFKNGDACLFTTGGLDSGGWSAALNYLKGHVKLAHFARLEAGGAENGEAKVVRDSTQY